ncbi:peptidoglycan DD-metalloendopeptidase family protein [Allostreptomyces psammosilenae]|uniref:LasA protease n=1 Tax=Allostreptomyces psammosilenae TaxID=1892865 RepID=A0A852ZWA2_9ACTN|nr:peptidoglycan DD-metalloendopeptidase family protein [Allostreptomyces psammosilenae]NYI05530.1 LasA protease [Allostreptomyces psammosilenae]
MLGRTGPRLRRIGAAAALLTLVGALSLGAPGGVAADERPAPTLTDAVTERLLERGGAAVGTAAAGDTPRVAVTRSAGDWAFGTAVLATEPGSDRMPHGWLFLAERTRGEWRVALEGEEGFAEISGRSPLVGDRERPLFAQQGGAQQGGAQQAGAQQDGSGEVGAYANGDMRTGMALPTTVGADTVMTSGPHGWSGSAAPWSSLDFAGGDEVVRAARQGTAYTMCRGWVRVVHDRGYTTDYYHLWSNISANGTWVGAGAFLGYTGTDVTCGGAAYGRHVHFGLMQNGSYVGLAGHNLGKWVIENGAAAYQGSALHGSRRVYAGGALYNYGALGLTQGVVDTGGGTSVNRRTGPGTGYPVAGSAADGATVSVACSANGTAHTGRYGTTSLWNRLTDGTWVSDAYLWTGVNGPVNGWC